MTKKKKPKDKVTRSSPSGSHSSEFSSSDLAAESTSDLQVLALSGSSVSPDTAFATSVNPSGAVTAIIPDRAQQYPKSGIDNAANALSPDFTVPSAKTAETLVPVVSSGAVTATIPNNELSGAVKATTSAAPQETEKSAQEDAVKAILEEGEFVPPHSTEPIAAATVPMEKTPPVEKSNTPKPTENATSSGPQSAAEHWRLKHNASVCTRKHSGLKKDHPTLAGPPKDKALIAGPQKDKAPIASQYPIVGSPPITETRPFSSTLGTKKYTPASLQSDSETRLKKQLQTKQGHLQNHKNMFVVDLNGTGFISSGHSAQGIDPESDYSSESFSEEDDNPQIEADRYLPVVTRGMKKSARKARARGPLNL
ncbi:hypothetical protein Bca4012_070246 [Brassica carinata]